jgi:hypothetical protein
MFNDDIYLILLKYLRHALVVLIHWQEYENPKKYIAIRRKINIFVEM